MKNSFSCGIGAALCLISSASVASASTAVQLQPSANAQGDSSVVVIQNATAHFTTGVTTVSFGSGVVTGSVAVDGPTLLAVPIQISTAAPVGVHDVIVTTGSEVLSGSFTVNAGQASVISVYPNSAQPPTSAGAAITVSLQGNFTHWTRGKTLASFGAGISVGGGAEGQPGSVSVTGAGALTATLSIDPAATLGPRDLSITTGSEVERVAQGFTLLMCSSTPASVVSVDAGDGNNAPLNAVIRITYSAPIDRTTVSSSAYQIQGQAGNSTAAPNVFVDASGRVVTITPTALLGAYQPISLFGSYGTVTDSCGNIVFPPQLQFSTGGVIETTPLQLVQSGIPSGSSNLPLNARVSLRFNQPLDPAAASAGMILSAAGAPVAGQFSFSPDYTVATFTPANNLAANSKYTLNYTSALRDPAGLSLSNPGTVTFTTGAATGSQNTYPMYFPSNADSPGVPTNVTPTLMFGAPIDLASLSAEDMYLVDPFGHRVSATTAVSSDRMRYTLTPSAVLLPETQYRWFVGPVQSVTGVGGASGSTWFITGSGSVGAPSVVAVSPANQATGVPENVDVNVQFDQPINPTALGPNSLTVTGPNGSVVASGTVTAGQDGRTVSWSLPSAVTLAPNTVYTVKAANIYGEGPGASQNFSSSFTTGTTVSTPVCCQLWITSSSPVSGATNVTSTAPIVLTYNEPPDPTSFGQVRVSAASTGIAIPGAWTVKNSVATFTPSSPYPPGARINVNAWGVRSYAGIYDDQSVSFSTATYNGQANFQVLAATPASGQTGVPGLFTISLSFSGPVDPNTLTIPGALQLFAGDSNLSPPTLATMSRDGRTVTLGQISAPSPTITVFANSGIRDIYGNALQPFQWSFTTGAPTPTTGPRVVQVRPAGYATDVSPTAVVDFFLDRAGVDPSTLTNGVIATANGIVLQGTTTLLQGGRLIQWQPAEPFPLGATVGVGLGQSVADLFGNPVQGSSTGFTVQGSPTVNPPQVSTFNPYYYQTVPRNSLFQIELDQPVLGSSVTLSDVQLLNGSNTPVAGSVTLGGANNNIIQFTPSAPLASTGNFALVMNQSTAKVTNMDGLPAPQFSAYFVVSGGSLHTAPSVLHVVPSAGSVVGTNAAITIQATQPIDRISVNASTVRLLQGSVSVPLSYSFDPTGQQLILTPQAALSTNAQFTVSLAGVYDVAGNPLQAWSSHFSTGGLPDFIGPQLINGNVISGSTLALNDALVLRFDKPIASGTANSNTLAVLDNITATVSGSWSESADGETITFVPSQPWPMYSSISLQVTGNVTDVTGNPISLPAFYLQFSTGGESNSTQLQVQSVNPEPAATNVPLNALIQVQLNEPIQTIPAGAVTLTEAGQEVAATATLSGNGQSIAITPSQLLLAQTRYTLTVSGISDAAGHTLAAPCFAQFTTQATAQTIAASVVSVNPPSSATAVKGSDPITVYLSGPIDPATLNSTSLTLGDSDGGQVQGTLSIAADRKSVSFQPSSSLIPGVQYGASFCINFPYCSDISGNQIQGVSWQFTTGTASSVRPSVQMVSPPNGTSNVPQNSQVLAQFSAVLNAGLVNAGNVTLSDKSGHPVSGTVTVPAGQKSVLFTLAPGTALAAGMTYRVSITGVVDENGNVSTPFASSFTTSSAVQTPGPGALTVLSVTPAPGSVLTSNTAPVMVQFSEPVDPISVQSAIQLSTPTSQYLAGGWTVSGNSAVFKPASPYPANTLIRVDAVSVPPSWALGVTDYAGNTIQTPSITYFTAANTVDTTAPTVTSVTPAKGSTGAGQNTPVVVTFSKSIDQSTSKNVALFASGSAIRSSASVSADNRTLTLSAGQFPSNTLITVVATPGVKDLSGNSLVDFQSSFTTGNPMPPMYSGPSVVSVRPANGAVDVPLNAPVSIFVSGAAVNPSSVQTALHVAQNGQELSGTATLIDGQIIQFVPSSSYLDGAVVQIYLDGTLEDVNGTPFKDALWQSSFTTQRSPSTSGPALISSNVLSGTPMATNNIFQYAFDQPLDPNTVNASTVQLGNDCAGGYPPIAITLTGPANNIVQVVPSGGLMPNCFYSMTIGSSSAPVKNVNGQIAQTAFSSFQTSAGPDATLPLISGVSPPNGFTKVGINAAVYLKFSKAINPASVSPANIQLTAGANTAEPYSLSFDDRDDLVTLTPQAALPANTPIALTVKGITDDEGRSVPAVVSHFTTGNGPDLTSPQLVSISPGASPIPLNTSAITLTFNKPMNPTNLMAPGFDIRASNIIPTTVHANSSMTAFTYVLNTSLTANQYIYFDQLGPILDIAGNALAVDYFPSLLVGSARDTSALQVVGVNPPANLQNVPQNVTLQVQFSAQVSPSALTGIELLQGGTRVPAVVAWDGDTIVSIIPGQVLTPNAPYTISIAGVKDALGNSLSGPFTSSFTTAAALFEGTPTGTVITPNSTTNVNPDTAIQLKFSQPMNPLRFVSASPGLLYLNYNTPIPTTLSLSADGLTATWTPTSPLASGSYSFSVNSGSDIAGNQFNGLAFDFTVP